MSNLPGEAGTSLTPCLREETARHAAVLLGTALFNGNLGNSCHSQPKQKSERNGDSL